MLPARGPTWTHGVKSLRLLKLGQWTPPGTQDLSPWGSTSPDDGRVCICDGYFHIKPVM